MNTSIEPRMMKSRAMKSRGTAKCLGLTASTVIVAALVLAGCSFYPEVRGSGNLVTGRVDASAFSRVSIGQTCTLSLSQGDEYAITITTDDNVLEYVKAVNYGEELDLHLNPHFNYTNITFSAEVTMPEIRELDVAGASRAVVESFSSTGDVVISASGASTVELKQAEAGHMYLYGSGACSITGAVTASATAVDLSGASEAELRGTAGTLTLAESGASKGYFKEYSASSADITLSGASYAEVVVNGTMDTDLSGASELRYTGNAILGSTDLSGGSTMERIDEKPVGK